MNSLRSEAEPRQLGDAMTSQLLAQSADSSGLRLTASVLPTTGLRSGYPWSSRTWTLFVLSGSLVIRMDLLRKNSNERITLRWSERERSLVRQLLCRCCNAKYLSIQRMSYFMMILMTPMIPQSLGHSVKAKDILPFISKRQLFPLLAYTV